jgi:hypothetical protein
MDDVMLTKLADVQLGAFLDELEKIAGETGEDFEMLKEALLREAREALQSGVGRVAKGLEGRGMTGAGKFIHALNVPIETGAAGRALQNTGQHLMQTATPGVFGGMRHGVGEAISHMGHPLAGGGGKAVARAAWNVVNPVGTLAETGLTGAGHVASRAMKLDPTGRAHGALTKVMPRVGEIAGAAGMAGLAGAPVGLAGMIGGKALGAAGAMAPGLAETAHHAIGGLGHAGAELAHHVGSDVLGTHGHGVLSGLRRFIPRPAVATV